MFWFETEQRKKSTTTTIESKMARRRIIHQDKAKINYDIIVTHNSHEGRTAKVLEVGDEKCTVRFYDGEPGKFVKHGDYQVLEKKKKDAQIMDAMNKNDIELNFENESDKELKSRVTRVEVAHDIINIAAKVAAVTDSEEEALRTIMQKCKSLEEMTIELIEQRKTRK